MKINYQDKEFINADLSTPNKNKVTDLDMNEIKNVVNANADTLDNTTERMTDLEQDANTRIGDMEQSVEDIENDISQIQDDIDNIEANIDNIEENTYTKSEVYTKTETDALLNTKATTTALGNETQARQNADVNLQNQIDSIVASSDVVDIVGTYQDLQNYDTSHLGDNDIIKVLNDSTHNNATSYFRWKKSTSTWQYIGSEGPYYTIAQSDALLNGKVNVVEGKGLSTNDFTDEDKTKLNGIETGAEVNVIEVVKVNGSTQTITNKGVDISVPTKTSDLTNDSDYVKNTDYATSSVGGVIKTNEALYSISMNNGNLYAQANTYEQYQGKGNGMFISKGTLENVITGKDLTTKTYVDNLVGDIGELLDEINRGGDLVWVQ